MSETVLIVLALIIAIGVVTIIVLLLRPRAPVADPAAEQRLAELKGHVQALQQTVHQRLDAVTQNLGESMKTSTKNTTDHLQQLHARLAVIDSAQKNITDLATQVNSLQGVLANKQSRGAFGQGQLEAIIADVLPKGAYEFQYKLSNGKMPDCAIFMPDKRALIIDAKFPLEAMTALRNAVTEDERKQSVARVKQDFTKHISDIAEKYFISGETQDIALMFIPSESLYADLYERFDDLVQRARRARVVIVSPNMAFLAIQLVRQMRKDAEMQDAVETIRNEVGMMMKDVGLLGDRVRKLQGHFGQTTKDMDDILTSTGRIEKRAARIEDLEFDGDAPGAEVIAAPIRKLGTGE